LFYIARTHFTELGYVVTIFEFFCYYCSLHSAWFRTSFLHSPLVTILCYFVSWKSYTMLIPVWLSLRLVVQSTLGLGCQRPSRFKSVQSTRKKERKPLAWEAWLFKKVFLKQCTPFVVHKLEILKKQIIGPFVTNVK
jgi:hypothetical protein